MLLTLLLMLPIAPLQVDQPPPPAPLDAAEPAPDAPSSDAPPSETPAAEPPTLEETPAGEEAAPAARPPRPDAVPSRDDAEGSWAGLIGAPIGGAAGCGVCGVVPFTVGSAAILFMLYAVTTGFAEGGCGGALLVVFGVVVGLVFGGIPALVLGPLAAIGALIGVGFGSWLAGRNPLAPMAGALAGLVVGLLGSLAGALLFSLVDERLRIAIGITDALLLPVLVAGLLGAGALGALAGPVAVGGAVLADLAFGAPLEGGSPRDDRAYEDDDEDEDDRRRRRPRRRDRAAMAF